MRKSSSKESVHTNTELKRYLGALHEEHMGAIKAMGEQFVDVNRKLDSHTEMIGKLSEDMGVVKTHIEMIKSDLDTVQSDVEVMKSDLGIIKNDLKQKVDRTEFATLERRVTRLESKVR